MNKILYKNKYQNRKYFFIFILLLIPVIFFYIYFKDIRSVFADLIVRLYYTDNIDSRDQQIIDLTNRLNELEIQNRALAHNMSINNTINNIGSSSSFFDYRRVLPLLRENVFYNNLILKVKDNQNIFEGDLVYALGGYPIAVIEKIEDTILTAKLFSADSFSFTIILKDENNNQYDYGATGDGMYNINSFVDIDANVNIGQKVFYKNNIDKEIGYITKVEIIEKENKKKIFIKTYYKDNSGAYLFVR